MIPFFYNKSPSNFEVGPPGALSLCSRPLDPDLHTCLDSQGTFYGDDQWAGSCAGTVGPPWHSGVWPPANASYTTSMHPGSPVALNVALNSRQYSTDMCGQLLYVRSINAGCTTCGTTPMPEEYMLARVTNECPECLFGSLDFGMKGDGRCGLTSTFLSQSLRHLYS